MRIGEIAKKPVVTALRTETITVVAKRMRDKHVGTVVIVEADFTAGEAPIGILTDRDIVLHVIAKELPADTTLAGEIMSIELVSADASDTVDQVLELMLEHGIRRIPILGGSGALCGIIAMDDILMIHKGDKLASIPQQQINWERAVN